MKKSTFLICMLVSLGFQAQEITLNHNIGNTIVDQLYNVSCTGGGVDWARVFVLEDFGVTDEYTLHSGSFGIEQTSSAPGDGVTIHVYAIDAGFPGNFDESALLGSSDLIDLPYTSNALFTFDFPTPIAIPSNVEMILVEVSMEFQTQNVFMGGTQDSYDYSWIKTPGGCLATSGVYVRTFDIDRPDLNYYITVTGDHILGLDDSTLETVSLASNPVQELLRLQLPQGAEKTQIMIFDLHGKTMSQHINTPQIDVSSLAAGMYFVKVSTPSGSITKKFIKL